ncbi:MAG: dihydroorotase [Candidatus Omnitrophica bacterium]|nr:dihydroorotase [Candidatus Omnitrophota bacterium]
MKILIKNGRVIDPENNLDELRDILVSNGKIDKVARNIDDQADEVIEAKDKIVLPGLVDMHVHLREPGREDKETVASGTASAAKGGVTSVLAMPNTDPVIDCAENVALLKDIIHKTANVNVFICASITRSRLGQELTDIARLKKEGVLAISDDGASVDSGEVMSAALQQAKGADLLVICHSEDKSLSRVHITHVTCRESVEIISQAKKKGSPVTCDATPHHFALCEEAVLGFDTNFKMNPPLRSKDDMLSLRQALSDGTIDAIASDHAPHTENEKEIEFERAEFGVIGLETELAASITELVHTGLLDWKGLVEKLALNPAKILGIARGTLSVGASADLIVVSADREWLVEKEALVSKSKNCAFLGKKLKGSIEYTVCNGKIIYKG